MLPIPDSLLGAALSLAARAARGEVDVDDETRERLQELRSSLEDVSDLVGDLSAKNPATWAGFAGRAMDRTCETHGRAETPSDWREPRGFDRTVKLEPVVVDYLRGAPEVDAEVVFTEGDESVELLELANGVTLASDVARGGESGAKGLYRREATPKSEVRDGIASAFWSSGEAVRLSWGASEPVLESVELGRFVYRGEKRALIDRWREFLEAGVSRSILLQGEPGVGKTTLCCHAARELGDRTLLLTGNVLDEQSTASWSRLLEMLAPTVVIVDDVDRTGGGGMGGGAPGERLRFFSEGRRNVPLVLFTANDHSRLPEAVRRPGRIDRIVQFEETSADIRRDIVRSIAEEQEVEVDATQVEALEALMDEYSAAYVRELLRRAAVLGWERVSLGEDTFGMHREYDRGQEWLRAHGFESTEAPPEFLLEAVLARSEVEVAVETEHETLKRVELPTGAEFCIQSDDSEPSVGLVRGFPVRNAGEEDARLREGVAQVFWRGRRAVLLDALDHEYVAKDVEYADAEYLGPQAELLDRMRTYREAGLRRSILLQGPPGTGKSTLCMQAARELADRCLFLTPQCFDDLRVADWEDLTSYLQPDMVVVDDVDRVGRRQLEAKLRLFEDRYCDIPHVLFTSNDANELPRPMKRPGRIDQIVEIEPPDDHQRLRLIEELADRIGVEVPEARRDWLDAIYRKQSPAHVREILRRAKTVGWSEVTDIYGDRTFDADWEGHEGPDEEESDVRRSGQSEGRTVGELGG